MCIKLLKSNAIFLCRLVVDLDESCLHENDILLFFWVSVKTRINANGVWTENISLE